MRPASGHARYLLAAAASLLMASVAVTPLSAADREHKAEFSTLRLLNAGNAAGRWQSGIELVLQPGWKTYWRVPGESGVPPQFDWSGSSNVADVQVDMPVPKRFSDNNGEGIGYQGAVVFPVSVRPQDASKPVKLALQAFYAVCNNICVPVQAEASLELSAETVSGSDRYRLGLVRNEMPHDAATSGMTVKALRLVEQDGKQALEVAISGIEDPANTDIFVETGTTAYLRKPELAAGGNTEAIYHLIVDGLPAGTTLKGKPVRLTIAAGETSLVHDGFVQ